MTCDDISLTTFTSMDQFCLFSIQSHLTQQGNGSIIMKHHVNSIELDKRKVENQHPH